MFDSEWPAKLLVWSELPPLPSNSGTNPELVCTENHVSRMVYFGTKSCRCINIVSFTAIFISADLRSTEILQEI